jgi:magnesium and cobalt transporter
MSETSLPADKHLPAKKDPKALVAWLKNLIGKKSDGDDTLREALEDYIEELSSEDSNGETSSSDQEKILLGNILELRNMTVTDVMIPRVDIAAVDVTSSPDMLIKILAEKQHSRVPVYKETLDDILGIIHMKDVIAKQAQEEELVLKDMVREVPIVSPSLPVLDLLLLMRETRQHMVFIVDEYGGIDGLATLGDLLACIVGEIQDEYETAEHPTMRDNIDGSVIADARISIRDFEEKFGTILSDDERDEVETLGGYVSFLADRVPARGEIINHKASNLIFEILEADPRRIIKLKIRSTAAPKLSSNSSAEAN